MPSVARRALKALVWVLRPARGGTEVLLLQRPARRGAGLHPVTGKAEDGEEPLAAAAREALEETGIEGALTDLAFVHEFTTHKGRLAEEHAFLLRAAPRAEVKISDEHDGFVWVEPEAARAAVSWQAHRESLELALVEFGKPENR
jgi:8-oxo-dGTP pyrophosphatase MutT (NUDIX family)